MEAEQNKEEPVQYFTDEMHREIFVFPEDISKKSLSNKSKIDVTLLPKIKYTSRRAFFGR